MVLRSAVIMCHGLFFDCAPSESDGWLVQPVEVDMSAVERIRQAIADHPIVIFMKGSPDFPQCGFSMRASQALLASGARLAHVDVLADPEVRSTLPQVSNWPTFPQVFIKGELVGGCDIVLELYQSGELKRMVQEALAAAPA